MCLHVCRHVCVHVCFSVSAQTHLCVCFCICIYTFIHACIHVWVHFCFFVCAHTHLCVHIHICMCVFLCVLLYIPKHIDRRQRRGWVSSYDILSLIFLRTFSHEPRTHSFLAMLETRKPQESCYLSLPQNWGYRSLLDVQLITRMLGSKFQSMMLCSKHSWAPSHLLGPNFKFWPH